MPGQSSVSGTLKRRFGGMTKALQACAPQAATYGACVQTNLASIKTDVCAAEFQQLLQCIKKQPKV
eukprot:m.490295 g.490295  ORF g.490295 m.490295 type:complete len:66 (+) comp27781_c0_seq1:272-469(+)